MKTFYDVKKLKIKTPVAINKLLLEHSPSHVFPQSMSLSPYKGEGQGEGGIEELKWAPCQQRA